MKQRDEHEVMSASKSTLFERFAPIILAYVRWHSTSWQDAEDLTFEVFLTALEHDDLSWMTGEQQLAWLRRVAHNKIVDGYRRPAHPPAIPLEQVVENIYPDEAPLPEQLLLRREELERLYTAISKLSLEQQQVLQLRFGEGLRFAEIALLLNKRESTVRKICSRSLALLRSIYDES
jgi:RNA polymerase sigma-70 factor (ECF subfamily)